MTAAHTIRFGQEWRHHFNSSLKAIFSNTISAVLPS
jgi:hypothetical protein